MDKIILGTLYVVFDYIKRNDIEMFYSSSFDMDDIISSFNEVWINKIYNGDLLRVDSFSNIFTASFFSEVYKNLCNDEKVPIMFLTFDTNTSETGVKTRLEAFYDMIEMRRK